MQRLKIVFIILGWLGFAFFSVFSDAGFDEAQSIMRKSDCLSCHSVNQKIVGPSFNEVSKRYQNDSNAVSKLIQSVKLGAKGSWGEISMPPHPALKEDEIKKIIQGILSLVNSGTQTNQIDEKEKVSSVSELQNASQGDILKGQALFQGTQRFVNRGPTCNSCHHVKNDAVIGGGVLAKDLTSVFSRLGEPGVRAILGEPPFPVMQQAYRDRALTKDEIFALVAFLNDADQKKLLQRPKDYGMGLFLSGILGAVLLMIFYMLFGIRRKKYSVNQAIYDRQIKSK